MENINNKNYNENILGALNLLLMNIPQNLEPLEKVRWLYIKLGELFSYDYRVATDINVAKKEVDFSEEFISRYQTCKQISQIFNLMLNNIDEKIKSKIITRENPERGNFELKHEAIEITVDNSEKYLLDLTLDLYLIQSGCQTKQFGFTTNLEGTYDIIPLSDCKKMDTKMGLIKYGEYTDKKISDTKSKINMQDYSKMNKEEEFDYKINSIKYLIPKLPGYHESKMFIGKVLLDILTYKYKEYNLTYKSDNNMQLVTCYKIEYENDKYKWYLYNSQIGLIETSTLNIKNMLASGFKTNSKTLEEELDESNIKVR